MSSVLVQLLDKGLIVLTGLVRSLTLKLLITLIFDFTDSFTKFTKQLFLLRLADRIFNFQNSFVSRISSKHTTPIRHWHEVYMASRYHINVSTSYLYCDNSYYLHNCSNYNSTLCLRSSNIQSIFNFVIFVVVVTPYLFIFRSIKSRQLVDFFDFAILYICNDW